MPKVLRNYQREDFSALLNELKNSDYKLTADLVEAKSLATVACIILQELV